VYGSNAKSLALLIAVVNCLWYLALVPVILAGEIFPDSFINLDNKSTSL
jgi:hypothetical protein